MDEKWTEANQEQADARMDREVDYSKVNDVADGMLKRYSTPKVALEFAFWHSMDYPAGSDKRTFWAMVYTRIQMLHRL